MAVSHISLNDQTQHGRMLRSALNKLDDGLQELTDLLAIMATMVDGDGSSSTHFPYVTSKFGFASDSKSKEAFDELNSLKYKLSTNASVTDVNAAMLQAFHKFG